MSFLENYNQFAKGKSKCNTLNFPLISLVSYAPKDKMICDHMPGYLFKKFEEILNLASEKLTKEIDKLETLLRSTSANEKLLTTQSFKQREELLQLRAERGELERQH